MKNKLPTVKGHQPLPPSLSDIDATMIALVRFLARCVADRDFKQFTQQHEAHHNKGLRND